MGERPQRFGSDTALIELGLDRKQRAAFNPAVTNAKVFWETLRIVGGAQEVVGVLQVRPFSFGKFGVAAVPDVVVHGYDEERRSIRRCKSIRVILKPRHEVCRLRNFVWNLAIAALKVAQKIERCSGGSEVARCVEPKYRPLRVAPKKPSETGTLAIAGGAIPGNQAGAQKRIFDQPLEHADPGPVV